MVGGGPAGRAIAAACSDLGLRVTLIDPAPHQVWPDTYASWLDELPPRVRQAAPAAVTARMLVYGTAVREWPRPYSVLDNAALWKHLWREDVVEVTGRAVAVEHGAAGSTVRLRNGHVIDSTVVVDASGSSRVLSGGRPQRPPAQQTAVGLILDATDAGPLCPADTGVFMDWHAAADTRGGWPTFHSVTRVTPDRVLVTETSLVRRPGLPLALLRRRLRGRLSETGIAVPPDATEERVRFPVDDPIPDQGRVVPFGTAAGHVHLAAGSSVAASLRLAPWIASALSAGLASGPAAAAKAAWSILWSPAALVGHGMWSRVLQGLLSLPPPSVPELFEVFFSLPPEHRSALWGPGQEAVPTAAAMSALFGTASWSLRGRLLLSGLSLGRHPAQHGMGGF